MQTFIPLPDFGESARVLDRQRLGKQRIETLQLIRAIKENGAWQFHPAAVMWSRNLQALCTYGETICLEWRRRGYKDTVLDQIIEYVTSDPLIMPSWWGDEKVHSSHRANLLRKDYRYYREFGWLERPAEGYYWPGVSTHGE